MASLAVVFYHFGNVLDAGVIRSASEYGKFGVQVFFVISGFVICYSLSRANYEIRSYFTFILKRLARLDPPYLATIGIILLLGSLSRIVPLGNNGEFHASFLQVLLHLGYLNSFSHYLWLNDVFWTLGIEFQFYILIGLAYPVFFSRNLAVRILGIVGLAVLHFTIHSQDYVFDFIFLFVLGIVVCQYKTGLIGKAHCAILLVLMTLVTLYANGIPSLLAGEFAVISILFLNFRNTIFTFLGNISYSLYLLHSPIGRRALNVAMKITQAQSQASKVAVILFAVGVSIVAAYIFYLLVEKPARDWSARIQYPGRRKRELRRETEEAAPIAPALEAAN